MKSEYNVACIYDAIPVTTARWVTSDNEEKLAEFRKRAHDNLAEDGSGFLVYLAATRINLSLTEERWPDITFSSTREL